MINSSNNTQFNQDVLAFFRTRDKNKKEALLKKYCWPNMKEEFFDSLATTSTGNTSVEKFALDHFCLMMNKRQENLTNFDIITGTYLYGYDIRQFRLLSLTEYQQQPSNSTPYLMYTYHVGEKRAKLRKTISQRIRVATVQRVYHTLNVYTNKFLSTEQKQQRDEAGQLHFCSAALSQYKYPEERLYEWISSQQDVLANLTEIIVPSKLTHFLLGLIKDRMSIQYPSLSSLVNVTHLEVYNPTSCIPFAKMPQLKELHLINAVLDHATFMQIQCIPSLKEAGFHHCTFVSSDMCALEVPNSHIEKFHFLDCGIFSGDKDDAGYRTLTNKGPYPLFGTDNHVLLKAPVVKELKIKHFSLDYRNKTLGKELIIERPPLLDKLDIYFSLEDKEATLFNQWCIDLHTKQLITAESFTVTHASGIKSIKFSCENNEQISLLLLAIKIYLQDAKHYPRKNMTERFCRESDQLTPPAMPFFIRYPLSLLKTSTRYTAMQIAIIALIILNMIFPAND